MTTHIAEAPLLTRVKERIEKLLTKGTGIVCWGGGLAQVTSANVVGYTLKPLHSGAQTQFHKWDDQKEETLRQLLSPTPAESQALARKQKIQERRPARNLVVLYVIHKDEDGAFRVCAGRVEETPQYYKLVESGGYTEEFRRAFSAHGQFIPKVDAFTTAEAAIEAKLATSRTAKQRHAAIVATYDSDIRKLKALKPAQTTKVD